MFQHVHFNFSVSILEEETVRSKIRPYVLHNVADCVRELFLQLAPFLVFLPTTLCEHLSIYEILKLHAKLIKQKAVL